MELARVLSGQPYVTNVPTYDSALIDCGELVMRHASWAAAANKYYITAYVVTSATEAEDTIGVAQASSTNCGLSKEASDLYNIGSDGYPDSAQAAGFSFQPCIINPDATYFATYDQATAISITTASTSTTITITSLEQYIGSGWLYTTDGTDSAATYNGLLRFLTVSASGSCTIDSAATVDTSTDVIKVLPIGHRLVALNAAATGLKTTSAAASTIYLEILENYISAPGIAKRAMRYWLHKGLTVNDAIITGEIAQLKHCLRGVVL